MRAWRRAFDFFVVLPIDLGMARGASPRALVPARQVAAFLRNTSRHRKHCEQRVYVPCFLRRGIGKYDALHQRRFFASSAVNSNNDYQQQPLTRRITYLTDVEGDRDYLTRYVEQSQVLCFRHCAARMESTPATLDNDQLDQAHFVFPYTHCIDFIRRPHHQQKDCLVYGGDVWDQGGSDLYVIRQLLDLKARYPDAVHFVMGNRDINKMRFSQELQPDDEKNGQLPEFFGVYFMKGTGIDGDPDLCVPISPKPVERLQWILRRTMGSPRAFSHRLWELQQERAVLGIHEEVQDVDVVESYQQSCHPFGEMGLYLANATLALRLGGALFLHGSLPLTAAVLQNGYRDDVWDDLTFAMPWLPKPLKARDVGVHDIDDWISELNNFAAENVRGWRKSPYTKEIWSSTGGYLHSKEDQPYAQLLSYGMRKADGIRNPTVVYSRWCASGMPTKFFPDNTDQAFCKLTRDFFRRTGLQLICAGHQPQGDLPTPIRIPNGNRTSWVLSCDTSYSGDTHYWNLAGDKKTRKNKGRGEARSGRGSTAVCEVLMEQCTQTGEIVDIHYHGRLSDGTTYRAQSLDLLGSPSESGLTVGGLASGPQVPLPTESPNGNWWWTRALFSSDGSDNYFDSYLIATGEGFDVWNRVVKR